MYIVVKKMVFSKRIVFQKFSNCYPFKKVEWIVFTNVKLKTTLTILRNTARNTLRKFRCNGL